MHLIAKRHLVIFKHNEVIDNLAWRISDFRVMKNVWAETQRNIVNETT